MDLPSGKYIVLNVNSAGQSRKIPLSSAVQLLNALRSRYGIQVLMTGSLPEYDFVQSIIDSLDDSTGVHNFAGTTMFELATLLKRSELLISADSGIAHLGNALGTSTIVFFGNVDDKTNPWNRENLRVVRKPGLECMPCFSENCKFGEPLCLMELSNEHLFSQIQEITGLIPLGQRSDSAQ
jgi:ADP-heptose:LPS heptosyltransferase